MFALKFPAASHSTQTLFRPLAIHLEEIKLQSIIKTSVDTAGRYKKKTMETEFLI